MNPNKYSITFACYNAVDYTKLCIESMVRYGTPLDRLTIVDNGSTDATREYLQSINIHSRILNKSNLGCGVAWNQGVLANQSEWSIIMNNDVIVSPNWIENLIGTAENLNARIISPALIEGTLDYNWDQFLDTSKKMHHTHRIGSKHAVCLAVHESVWQEVGLFQPVPKLLGYEDTLFFDEVRKSQIKTAMTGASWLHHYGSITQNLMKLEKGLNQQQALGHRYNYKLLNQSWLQRKINKYKKSSQNKEWANQEIKEFGMSIHGLRKDGVFKWI